MPPGSIPRLVSTSPTSTRRSWTTSRTTPCGPSCLRSSMSMAEAWRRTQKAVSYTHLTLPTICSV
eukprot:3486981-Prorocentrum_lima.AAC.1